MRRGGEAATMARGISQVTGQTQESGPPLLALADEKCRPSPYMIIVYRIPQTALRLYSGLHGRTREPGPAGRARATCGGV